MKLVIRKKGSNRAGRPVEVTIYHNTTQDGSKDLIFETPDSYIRFEPENDAEARQLISAAVISYHNMAREDEARAKVHGQISTVG